MQLISKILFIACAISLSACSPSGSGPSSNSKISTGNISSIKLSDNQKEARESIQDELSDLSQGQYALETQDLEILAEEGLITEEELVAIKIVE